MHALMRLNKSKIMKATYAPAAPTYYTSKHRNEGKCYLTTYSLISLADKPHSYGSLYPLIALRIYGTGTANTACVWIHYGEVHTSGSGKATGYGYHRPSAAAHYAITNAGFTLSEPIDGRGESAIREALLAMAKALKIKRPAIVGSYA